jgi:hypothetical protein
MKACSHQPVARGHALAAPRACCAPASLAAYAMGATLWAPSLVLIVGQLGMVFGGLIPSLPSAGPVRLFAVVWLLRFALYIVGAARHFDYGYGINGVIVNRQLTLAEKAQRVSRDWFGILLILNWTAFMIGSLIAAAMG